ncbi:MAG: phosphotransferase family protein [Deltaproteobacteria bacterium]|nr:phosphotransferase family protein [Deltaproteobacteria bacterium]MBW2361770.1 phosphotransferase family protein [Deltaproteobacteria bacterium]
MLLILTHRCIPRAAVSSRGYTSLQREEFSVSPDIPSPASDVAPEDMRRSTRDPASLRRALEGWLAGKLPGDAKPEVSDVSSPSANGLSSETLLFDACWQERGASVTGSFVARVEPDRDDCPVFPVYDMEAQYHLLEIVAQRSRVPVPVVRWLELGSEHLGAPFFVMERAEGRVPPDVLPYTFGSWLSEATPEERRTLQDSSVAVLAELHKIDAASPDLAFLELDLPGETPLQRHFEDLRRYYQWMRGERRHPVLEQAFDWIESHWPDEEGETVVSWGDSRIGNILYSGFEPAAVLDWEMAARGPRELDLGWMVFLHCFFDEIARGAEFPGIPDFMQPADVAATYETLSGHPVRDFDFYQVYAALRHGIVMARVHERRVHFGEAEWPEDVDSVIFHRATLECMMDGSWWRRPA